MSYKVNPRIFHCKLRTPKLSNPFGYKTTVIYKTNYAHDVLL